MSVENFRKIPEVSSGEEKHHHITPGRVARKLSLAFIRRMPERVFRKGILATENAQRIIAHIEEKADVAETPWRIFFENILIVRDEIYLLANRQGHPDMWVRDVKHAFDFVSSPELEMRVLRTVEAHQRPDGQIPTAVGVIGSTPWHYADDESTLIYLIAAADLAKKTNNEFRPNPNTVRAALAFIEKHTSDGMYVSPKGERRGWLDAFKFPRSDVITQNQGLYAVSLYAANELGVPVNGDEIRTARSLYARLADHHGYLPFSARFNEATDASVLYPEYLAISVFGEQLLSDEVVLTTIENLPISKHGFKVLTTSPDGEYFDSSYFVTKRGGIQYEPGEYQNGGVWPLWDNTTLVVAELHGVIKPGDLAYALYREKIKGLLENTGWAEYVRTGGIYEEKFVTGPKYQLWNVAIPAQQAMADNVLQRV